MSAKKRKKSKKGAGGLVFNSVSAILICAALVLGISVFFRVSNFEVSGASRYTDEEIIAASGIREGSNLIFINREASSSQISEKLVYIGRVSVTRKLPNTVVIDIQESGTVACIETDSGTWIIDSFCRMLEPLDSGEDNSYITVTGFAVTDSKIGHKISVSEEDKPKAEYLEQLLTAMYSADILSDVTSIDMSTSGNPQFEYLGRFKVKMGKNDNVESKIAILLSAVGELEETDAGVIDLSESKSGSKKAYFSPG